MGVAAAKPIRSPSYPGCGLSEAIGQVRKIEAAYRLSPVDRVAAAKLIGYSSLSGPANGALSNLAQYGLLERAGKGEARVTPLARSILHPDNESEKRKALHEAAFQPSLFREFKERWPDIAPPEDGIVTYLARQGYNQTATKPAARAYLHTLNFLEEAGASESHETTSADASESKLSDDGVGKTPEIIYGGAQVGDLIQWESQGVHQFNHPMRVRLVHSDGQYVAVDGSTAGIPMSQVIVKERAPEQMPQPPMFPLGFGEIPSQDIAPQVGESEWMRNRLGGGTGVRLLVTGDMGPKQIGKLIKLLEAQRSVLEDEDDDSD